MAKKSTTIEIDIADIVRTLMIIKKELNKLDSKSIKIATDPYWYITTSEWDVMDRAVEPALGLISEDWEFLLKVLNEEIPFSYSVLDKISFILRAISEEIVPTSNR